METSFYVDLDYEDPSKNVTFHDLLDAYFDKYACGKELSKSKTKHYQVWIYSEKPQAYNNFIAICKKRFNLNGRATKNNRKQYGRIKGVIKDTDNMISYCIKDLNYEYKGLEESYMKEREEASYQKEEDTREKYDKFIDECKIAISAFQEEKFAPTAYEQYCNRLEIGTMISKVWYEHYETVIPRTTVPKVLYCLGLMTHEDIAKATMRMYIGHDPSQDY